MKQAVNLGPRGVRAVVALARYVVAHGSASRDAQLLGLALIGLSDADKDVFSGPGPGLHLAHKAIKASVDELGLRGEEV